MHVKVVSHLDSFSFNVTLIGNSPGCPGQDASQGI